MCPALPFPGIFRWKTDMERNPKEDRVLLIINDTTIHGTTRLQKYGFLLRMQYEQELAEISKTLSLPNFYDDWESYYYGPYSRSLKHDMELCIKSKTMARIPINRTNNSYRYSLTVRGRIRWREMLAASRNEVVAIGKKTRKLQTVQLEDLLRGIYRAYPKYTKRSVIQDSLD